MYTQIGKPVIFVCNSSTRQFNMVTCFMLPTYEKYSILSP